MCVCVCVCARARARRERLTERRERERAQTERHGSFSVKHPSALQHARGHIYLAHRSTVVVVASARRTPQSTPVRYTCASINCLRVRFVPHLDRKINPNWPLIRGFVALRHMLNQLLAAGSLAQEAPLHAFSHSKTLWQFISVAELCEFGLGINSKWQSSQ